MTFEQEKKPYQFSSRDETAGDPGVGWEEPREDALDELPYFDPHRLNVVSGEELSDMRLEPVRFCVEGLLPEGLSILGGAAKAGKSWLVLDLGVRVARGLPLWEIPTRKGDVLYLCLEDSLNRVQERLNRVTDDPPDNLFFSISAGTIGGGLCDQIRGFQRDHPELVLVVVDIFQVVRGDSTELSYAGDYAEVRQLKALAEELRISLLLVHHLRKQQDRDPLNMLSGTTGISGAADAVYVLQRTHRDAADAALACTGRDIEQRTLRLRFDSDCCRWECLSDSAGQPEKKLPGELEALVALVRERGSFAGTNTELAEQYNCFAGTHLSAKALKQKMNQWRYGLEECGLYFESCRSNGLRTVSVEYRPSAGSDASDANDAKTAAVTTCVPCVPCVTCDPAVAP